MKKNPLDLKDFWRSEEATRITESSALKQILALLKEEEALLFELTFYAAFAQRMMSLMKREGKDVEGFDRMQQSFKDVVERVRGGLAKLESAGFADAGLFLALDPASFARLLLLIGDLATVKSWLLSMGYSMRSDTSHNVA